MSRKIHPHFPFGPISIALLAALTASGFSEAKAQDAEPATPAGAPAAEAPATPAPATTPTPAAEAPATTPADVGQQAPKAEEPSQPKEVKQAGAPDKGKAERITVTGSRIRQLDLEGPKPVITVNAEEIKKSGATSVNDYLEKLTVASFGSSSYGSSYGAPAGTQGFDIHGLGSGNTLVLLNGRRLVRDPGLEIIDLSVIPTAAVERIEILKGTASSVYGTDAAAGVVNIITRKNYEGMSFGYAKTKSRYSGGGDHDQAYVIGGSSSDKSSNIITFQWDQSEATKIGNRPWVDRNYRSVYGSPFSYQTADGNFVPGANCGESKNVGPNVYCSYSYMDEWELGASTQKVSVFDDFTYNITDSTKAGFRIFATRKTALAHGGREGIDPATDGYMVSQAALAANHAEINGATPAPAYQANADRGGALGVLVQGRLVAAGADYTKTDQLTSSGTAYINHEFDNGSQLEFSFSESRIDRTHNWLNYWDNQLLSDAIWDGSYDVFADPAPGGLDAYRIDATNRSWSIARSAELTYTGNFDVGSRSIGYALGLSQIREFYNNDIANQTVQGRIKGLGGGKGEGDRIANAVYGELSVPVVSTLEASLAARYDDYNDVGDTFNPALGLQYRVGKEWLFRGNFGTGFKAPSLRDVHDTQATYYTSAFDYLKCNQAQAASDADNIQKYCEFEQSGTIVQGGNPDLKPEKSQNWNFFIGFEPVIGYGLSLEYYSSTIKDQIGNVTGEQLTKMEANGQTYPTGTLVIRDPVTQDITGFISPTTNIATTKTSGLEVSAYAKQGFSFGTLSYRTNYSYILNYERQEIPGGEYQKQLEIYGPRWKWNNTFGYGIGIHEISLASYSNGRIFKGVQSYGYLGAFTQWDLNYALQATRNVNLNIGAENIFAQTYPQDDSDRVFRGDNQGYSPTVYAKLDVSL